MTKEPIAKALATQSLSKPAQAMLDTMQVGVTQANADGEILYANPG